MRGRRRISGQLNLGNASFTPIKLVFVNSLLTMKHRQFAIFNEL